LAYILPASNFREAVILGFGKECSEEWGCAATRECRLAIARRFRDGDLIVEYSNLESREKFAVGKRQELCHQGL
jgi:hypothetical protein